MAVLSNAPETDVTDRRSWQSLHTLPLHEATHNQTSQQVPGTRVVRVLCGCQPVQRDTRSYRLLRVIPYLPILFIEVADQNAESLSIRRGIRQVLRTAMVVLLRRRHGRTQKIYWWSGLSKFLPAARNGGGGKTKLHCTQSCKTEGHVASCPLPGLHTRILL